MSEQNEKDQKPNPKEGVSPSVIEYLKPTNTMEGKPLEFKGKTPTTAPGKLGGKEI